MRRIQRSATRTFPGVRRRRFARLTCSCASGRLPAQVHPGVLGRRVSETAQRATCGGGCASVPGRWQSRERDCTKCMRLQQEEQLARGVRIAPELSNHPRLEGIFSSRMRSCQSVSRRVLIRLPYYTLQTPRLANDPTDRSHRRSAWMPRAE